MDVDQRGLYPTLLPVGSVLIVGVRPVYISHGNDGFREIGHKVTYVMNFKGLMMEYEQLIKIRRANKELLVSDWF